MPCPHRARQGRRRRSRLRQLRRFRLPSTAIAGTCPVMLRRSKPSTAGCRNWSSELKPGPPCGHHRSRWQRSDLPRHLDHTREYTALLGSFEKPFPDAQLAPADEGLRRPPPGNQIGRHAAPFRTILMPPDNRLDRLAQGNRSAWPRGRHRSINGPKTAHWASFSTTSLLLLTIPIDRLCDQAITGPVTGANTGIGRGIALALAEAEADIAAVDARAAQMNHGAGGSARPAAFRPDECRPHGIEPIRGYCPERWIISDGLDILVNNAGDDPPRRHIDFTEADWDL